MLWRVRCSRWVGSRWRVHRGAEVIRAVRVLRVIRVRLVPRVIRARRVSLARQVRRALLARRGCLVLRVVLACSARPERTGCLARLGLPVRRVLSARLAQQEPRDQLALKARRVLPVPRGLPGLRARTATRCRRRQGIRAHWSAAGSPRRAQLLPLLRRRPRYCRTVGVRDTTAPCQPRAGEGRFAMLNADRRGSGRSGRGRGR